MAATAELHVNGLSVRAREEVARALLDWYAQREMATPSRAQVQLQSPDLRDEIAKRAGVLISGVNFDGFFGLVDRMLAEHASRAEQMEAEKRKKEELSSKVMLICERYSGCSLDDDLDFGLASWTPETLADGSKAFKLKYTIENKIGMSCIVPPAKRHLLMVTMAYTVKSDMYGNPEYRLEAKDVFMHQCQTAALFGGEAKVEEMLAEVNAAIGLPAEIVFKFKSAPCFATGAGAGQRNVIHNSRG